MGGLIAPGTTGQKGRYARRTFARRPHRRIAVKTQFTLRLASLAPVCDKRSRPMHRTPGENDMANSPFDANPAFTKLGEDSRKAVIQAFDAMSNWRSELAEISEKNSDAVFDKMSEAAKALGWPTDFVELSRKQMQNASRMQLQAVDQVMGLWENQARSLGTPGQFPRASRICRASGAWAVLRKAQVLVPACSLECRISDRRRWHRSNSGCRPPRCGRRAGSKRCRLGWMHNKVP